MILKHSKRDMRIVLLTLLIITAAVYGKSHRRRREETSSESDSVESNEDDESESDESDEEEDYDPVTKRERGHKRKKIIKRSKSKMEMRANDENGSYESLEEFSEEVDDASSENVKVVFVVFRHGQSSPDIKEKSKFSAYFSLDDIPPDVDADITGAGIEQNLAVGKYLRHRYSKLLSPKYSSKEIQTRTIENDFAKRSVLLALAALYPPLKGKRRDDGLDLQAVPYDTVPVEEDDLRPYENCQKYKNLRKETIQQFDVQEKLDGLEEALHKIKTFTGKNYNLTDIYKLRDLWNIAQFLIKPGSFDDFLEAAPVLQEAARLSFWTSLYNSTLIRLATGVMMNEIFDAIDLIQDNVTTLKMYLVAGTDFNVAALMAASRVFAIHQPEAGAVFCLEIYALDKKPGYGVRAVYKPEHRMQTKILKIHGCEKNGYCSTQQFKKLCKKYSMTESEYKTECKS